jgi:hypothetical protein
MGDLPHSHRENGAVTPFSVGLTRHYSPGFFSVNRLSTAVEQP